MIIPYLTFPGSTETAFKFYRTVFGGEFTDFKQYQDADTDIKVADGDHLKILHIVLKTPNGIVLAGSDVLEPLDAKLHFGNNFQLSVEAESTEEAESLLARLSADGKVTMPFEHMAWGPQVGMVKDQFGINWMIIVSKKNNI